jgi:hypothetical protein
VSRRSGRSRFTPCPVTAPVKSHRLAVANDNVVLKLARADTFIAAVASLRIAAWTSWAIAIPDGTIGLPVKRPGPTCRKIKILRRAKMWGAANDGTGQIAPTRDIDTCGGR